MDVVSQVSEKPQKEERKLENARSESPREKQRYVTLLGESTKREKQEDEDSEPIQHSTEREKGRRQRRFFRRRYATKGNGIHYGYCHKIKGMRTEHALDLSPLLSRRPVSPCTRTPPQALSSSRSPYLCIYLAPGPLESDRHL